MAPRQGNDDLSSSTANGAPARLQRPSSRFRLVITDDEGKATTVALVRDEITIGRKKGNTIRLTERNISREHAKLARLNDVFVLEDLKSYNGIKVNDQPISAPHTLAPGDRLTIGDYQLAVELDTVEVDPGLMPASAVSPAGGSPTLRPEALADTGPIVMPVADGDLPARLVMLTPPGIGAEFPLSRPVVRIGRSEKLDIWVNHRSMSREHAEVRRDKDSLRVVDLGSANGTRINGREVRDATLEPGDLLEFGQVQFHFAGAGEEFDVRQRLIALEDDRRRSGRGLRLRRRVIATLAALALALVALWAGAPDLLDSIGAALRSSRAETMPGERGAGEEESSPQRQAHDEALRLCQAALQHGDFIEAVAYAVRALRAEPASRRALDCKRGAERQRDESATFGRGEAALRAGDIEAAYFAFEELPRDSVYRGDPQVGEAMQQFAETHVEAARELLSKDGKAAARHAGMVLAMLEPPPRLRAAAEEIQMELERARRSKRDSEAVLKASDPPVVGDSSKSRVATAAGKRDKSEPPAAATASKVPPATPAVSGSACSPMDANYSRCIVTTLEGRARTPNELALLIESYRQVNESSKAQQSMQLFVARFPTHRLTPHYRRILESSSSSQ